MALTATLDKTTYAPGDTMTLTVTSDKRQTTSAFDVAAGGETVHVTTTVQTPVTLTDSTHTWTLVSDDGKKAVYTSKA